MENISKIVVAQNQWKKVGYVLDVAIDEHFQKQGYYVVDEESEGEFLIRCENIVGISDEYILINDVSSLEYIGEKRTVLGKSVLADYQDLGVVQKIIFNGRKCTKLVTTKCEILSRNLREVGEDFVFVSFKRKKPSLKKKAFPKVDSDIVVQIQNFQKTVNPEKVRLSSNFYIGQVSTQDIFGYNNEKIVLSGEIITRSVVEKAKRHNKLNQLFFAIKR